MRSATILSFRGRLPLWHDKLRNRRGLGREHPVICSHTGQQYQWWSHLAWRTSVLRIGELASRVLRHLVGFLTYLSFPAILERVAELATSSPEENTLSPFPFLYLSPVSSQTIVMRRPW